MTREGTDQLKEQDEVNKHTNKLRVETRQESYKCPSPRVRPETRRTVKRITKHWGNPNEDQRREDT